MRTPSPIHSVGVRRRYPRPRTTLCSCSECGEVFTKPETLELHQAVRHAGTVLIDWFERQKNDDTVTYNTNTISSSISIFFLSIHTHTNRYIYIYI